LWYYLAENYDGKCNVDRNDQIYNIFFQILKIQNKILSIKMAKI
jgi:hypothetical protein